MDHCFVLILLLLGISLSSGYTISETWDASNFFSKFKFFNGADPTHGMLFVFLSFVFFFILIVFLSFLCRVCVLHHTTTSKFMGVYLCSKWKSGHPIWFYLCLNWLRQVYSLSFLSFCHMTNSTIHLYSFSPKMNSIHTMIKRVCSSWKPQDFQ